MKGQSKPGAGLNAFNIRGSGPWLVMLFDLLTGLLTTAVINGVVAVPMMARQLFQTHQTVNRVLHRPVESATEDGHLSCTASGAGPDPKRNFAARRSLRAQSHASRNTAFTLPFFFRLPKANRGVRDRFRAAS